MGTTLTGTTPQDTYDSLIKVTDNAPLTGSLKVLTDGLGNDSALALSTGAASVTGTLAVSGNATFDTNTLFVDAANNRVGVGTITPEAKLDIVGSAAAGSVGMFIENSAASTTNNSADIYFGTWGGSSIAGITNARISAVNTLGVDARTDLEFYTYDGASSAKRLSITAAGNVGIGTSSPDQKLNIAGSQATAYATSSVSEVVPLGGVNMTMQNTAAGGFTSMRFVSLDGSNAIGYMGFTNTTASIGGAFVFGQRSGGGYAEQVRIQSGGGISFNGDTAAANALDDYEEGTWTGTLRGSASDPTTAVTATGKYTKIGRVVTVEIQMDAKDTTGASGSVTVTGLPFTSSVEAQGAMMSDLYTFGASCTASNCFVSPFSTTLTFFTTGSNAGWAPLTHNAGTPRSLRGTVTYFV